MVHDQDTQHDAALFHQALDLAGACADLGDGYARLLLDDEGIIIQPFGSSLDGDELIFTYDTQAERTGISKLLNELGALGIRFKDLDTQESSLEDIFVSLVREERP